LNSEYKYVRLVGIKRKITKFKELYVDKFLNLQLDVKPKCFKDFKGIKYFHYSTNEQLSQIIERENIYTLILTVNDSVKDLSLPVFCYLFDCQHKYFPDLFSDEEIKNRDLYFKSMLNSYSRVLVNAISVKDDLIKFYNANPEHIYTLPFTPKLDINYLVNNEKIIEKYKLPKRFFMISNQFWVHKNFETAYHALAELIKDDNYKDVKLICTGKMEDYRMPDYINDLQKMRIDLQLDNQIINLGFIPKTDQIEIMKKSIALVQPTLFEGGPGGGSVWDALSLGIPSIMSDIVTNKEIKNELAIFFQTKNSDDLASKMKEVINANIFKKTDKELIAESDKNIQLLGDYLFSIILNK